MPFRMQSSPRCAGLWAMTVLGTATCSSALPLPEVPEPPPDVPASHPPPPRPAAGPALLGYELSTAPPAEPPIPRSAPLPSGFYNPMPGGVFAGYRADTGLDLAGSPRPVYALASGTLDYSEPGHTLWVGPRDTANTVRLELDVPIPYKGRKVTHLWYAHLSQLERIQAEGESPRRHVEAGERLGVSGTANGSPHLHIGMLLDGVVDQRWGSFLLEDDIRRVLGGWRTGARLPRE